MAGACCKVFGEEETASSPVLRPGMDEYEASAAAMWHALRCAPPLLDKTSEDVCQVDIVSYTVHGAYSIAVEHMIQNNLGVGEHAYEGIISCQLSAGCKLRNHVRSIVLWQDASRQTMACFEIFSRYWQQRVMGKGMVRVKMVCPEKYEQIWQRVQSDGGFWEDMAASPPGLSFGADEGKNVVNAVGQGLQQQQQQQQSWDEVSAFFRD